MTRHLLLISTLGLAVGCGGAAVGPEPKDKEKGPTVDTTNACALGTTDNQTVCYPAGPYGYDVGSVVKDFNVLGHRDINFDAGDVRKNPIATIYAHDYFQDKSIKALVVSIAAGWCGPCKLEQDEVIRLYSNYQKAGAGVRFLEAVIQNPDSSPATMDYVDSSWVTNDDAGWYTADGTSIPGNFVNFDIGIDPDNKGLANYYSILSIPAQIVITTTEVKINNKTYPPMSIVWKNNGVNTPGVKSRVDSILKAAK